VVKSSSSVADLARNDVANQPAQVDRVLRMLARDLGSGDLERWCGPLWRADRILAIGCGDSYHAAHVAQTWFEQIAGIPLEIELSWELAVRRAIFAPGTVPLVLSSSETDADSLAALRYLKRRNVPAVALVHGSSSSVAQEADVVLDCTQPDLGTGRTVAFLHQLCALAAATIAARHIRDGLGVRDGLPPAIANVPRAMEAALALEEPCAELGRRIADAGRAVFVGRGAGCPLAALGAGRLEAATRLRAGVFNGGDLKYRSRWGIQTGTPSVVLALDSGNVREAVSDARHVIAGGGKPWLIGATSAPITVPHEELRSIFVDGIDPLWAPFALSIPLQLVACHAARAIESSLQLTQTVREPDNKAANSQADS
jgi:glucosamine--fructose-6-phosphate aminotransferase (isomerizing)